MVEHTLLDLAYIALLRVNFLKLFLGAHKSIVTVFSHQLAAAGLQICLPLGRIGPSPRHFSVIPFVIPGTHQQTRLLGVYFLRVTKRTPGVQHAWLKLVRVLENIGFRLLVDVTLRSSCVRDGRREQLELLIALLGNACNGRLGCLCSKAWLLVWLR